MICDLLLKAQEGNDDAMIELVNRFTPLLKKYARKVRYADAYEDGVLFFIELIKKMDLERINSRKDQVIITYIKISVKNFYLKKFRKVLEEDREIIFSELTQEQKYYVEAKMAKQDERDIFIEFGIDSFLNEKEKNFIYLVYMNGYTTAEIARKIHKSRQAVNQFKQRTLNKLKKKMI